MSKLSISAIKVRIDNAVVRQAEVEEKLSEFNEYYFRGEPLSDMSTNRLLYHISTAQEMVNTLDHMLKSMGKSNKLTVIDRQRLFDGDFDTSVERMKTSLRYRITLLKLSDRTKFWKKYLNEAYSNEEISAYYKEHNVEAMEKQDEFNSEEAW